MLLLFLWEIIEMTSHYLKSNIKIEPLIWRWYAWAYLIPPSTAACNIVERHLKIMQSYIQNPSIHAQAVKDPNLLGGPFIDLDGQKIEEVKNLIEETQKNCEKLINLNAAIKDFDRVLQSEAEGDTLEGFYHRIPSPLRGLTEIVYDLNNKPSMRLIEPLFYRKYYTVDHQSIALSLTNEDHRKFVLSTPRIDQEDEVYLNIPFSSTELTTLLRMKEEPQDFNKLIHLFDIPAKKYELFQSFFTTSPPALSAGRNYQGAGIRIRYFGHACVLVQTKDVAILIDPVISYPVQSKEVQRYTLSDLPDHIDYVLITHNHQDHLMFETLLQLKHKIGHIVFPSNIPGALQDPSVKLIFQHIGFNSLIEMKELESIKLRDGEIIGLPFFGEHCDLNILSKLSYCLELKGQKLLFAADSNNLDSTLYENIFEYTGPIDMLFLGMECEGGPLTWLYGPLLTQPIKRTYDRNRTLSGSNFDKAWFIATKSKCKHAYVYAMGQEPWLNYVMALKYEPESIQISESDKFVCVCKENGIESERLFGKKEWEIV